MISIGKRTIGKGSHCFVIAEAGVNHNGDMALARKLIDAALEAGADAVKFQTFTAEELVAEKAPLSQYQKTEIEESHFDLIKRLELSRKEHQELFDYCKEKGIIFLSTPYDEKSADLLENLGVEAYKIGSGELTHIPLLKHVASKGKPMIISTGGSFLEEVKDVVEAVKSESNDQMVLLHCTSLYPTPLNQVNLNQMLTLSKEFGLEIGYSDHTLGIEVSLAAIALGACVIERHFTLDRNLPGPDHKASLEPKELKEMIKGSVEIEKRVKAGENPMAIIKELGVEEALGSAVKEPVQKEFVERDLGCRSVVARKDIAPGVLITEQMLAVKRPGTGIKPKDIYKIFNKKAKREIKKDQLLSWEDLE